MSSCVITHFCNVRMPCSLWLVTSCEHKSVSHIMKLAIAYGLKEVLSLAGKVHGSLARAGKVRGQTPKVQKQDKKKQPKGRAMKRIKYNRRFVNVGESTTRSSQCSHARSTCQIHYIMAILQTLVSETVVTAGMLLSTSGEHIRSTWRMRPCTSMSWLISLVPMQWWALARRRALTPSKPDQQVSATGLCIVLEKLSCFM